MTDLVDAGKTARVNENTYNVLTLKLAMQSDDWIEDGTNIIFKAEKDLVVPKVPFIIEVNVAGIADPTVSKNYRLHALTSKGIVGGNPITFSNKYSAGDTMAHAGGVGAIRITHTTMTAHCAATTDLFAT